MLTDKQAPSVISQNVQRILDALGWRQSDLSRATGDSEMRISLMIRGKRCPSAAFLSRVAEALQVSVDDLLSQPPKKSRQSA